MSNNFNDHSINWKNALIRRLGRVPFLVSILSILLLLYDVGFIHTTFKSNEFHLYYTISLIIGAFSLIGRYFIKKRSPRLKIIPLDFILLLFLFLIVNQYFKFKFFQNFTIFNHPAYTYVALFLVFFREFSAIKFNYKRAVITPAQLFIYSFLSIIIFGAGLLMLPTATHSNISFIDALFTSTSAVCVTGLIVVDTGSFFTEFGQMIILTLIQIGGIGIMTFASYFSFFFRGEASYENQLALREMSYIDKIGEVFSVLKKIIFVTFFIEIIGAFLVFQTIKPDLIPEISDRVFFSIFHSISGFCNAGFSTLEHNLLEPIFQYNYSLHIIIAVLIIIGGIGFPIVFNLVRYLLVKSRNLLKRLFRSHQPKSIPRIINVNTRIVLATTFILIFLGTLLFFIFEYQNSLSNHSFWGKIVTSFFGAVTTRTAGFNTVDTSILRIPTTLFIVFLMWIGASPGSTGGGIKTSTFAIAILNILKIVRGKSRLEVFKREISEVTVNRSFAIIILSIFVISLSIFLITIFDPHLGLMNITFESVSAFSTVGLSRGITADFCIQSKIVLILTMFIGRVSMLTILIAFFKKISSEKYRYPTENILIN